MKLIVGLGNPGAKYQETRHNVGFDVVARLARQFGTGTPRQRFQGEVLEAGIRGERTLLLTPLTYMNESGASVLAARDFYKIEYEDTLIVCDDFNLPLGKLRIRGKGSAGGQKGLGDIVRRLGTDAIPRLRIGIGSPPPGREYSGFVLSRFSQDEQPIIRDALDRAAQAACEWAVNGLATAMNIYNADSPSAKEDGAP